MISITCTQCRTVLTIDEAFAGGVCRCQHCGTIQTVPAHLKPTPTSAYASPSNASSKSLYQNVNAPQNTGGVAGATSPSGLDELAQVVASSSGLTGSGLTNSRLTTAGPAPAAAESQAPPIEYESKTKGKKPPLLLFLAIGAVALVLLLGVGLVFVFATRSSVTLPPVKVPGTVAPTGVSAFCDVPIAGNQVIYLLDRANSIRDSFDPVKAAVYASINALGPDRKFAVILWNNGTEDLAYPPEGFRNATSDQIAPLEEQLRDVVATGESHLRSALEKAMARNPSTIVIVTAKSTLDEEDSAALATAQHNAGGKIKFDTFAIGNADNGILKMAADASGGEYRQISDSDLRKTTP